MDSGLTASSVDAFRFSPDGENSRLVEGYDFVSDEDAEMSVMLIFTTLGMQMNLYALVSQDGLMLAALKLPQSPAVSFQHVWWPIPHVVGALNRLT